MYHSSCFCLAKCGLGFPPEPKNPEGALARTAHSQERPAEACLAPPANLSPEPFELRPVEHVLWAELYADGALLAETS